MVIPAMVPTPAPGRIMALVRITAEALWWWPSGIGRTTAVRDIGRAIRITPGGKAIGRTETVKESGDPVITSCADIDRVTREPRLFSRRR
jgi:hypothetical protein